MLLQHTWIILEEPGLGQGAAWSSGYSWGKVAFHSETAVTLKAAKDRKSPTDTMWKSLLEVPEGASAQELGVCGVNPRSQLSVILGRKDITEPVLPTCVATAAGVTYLQDELHKLK